MVSVGNDFKLILKNYQTNQLIATYHTDEQKITCLRFSPQGHLIVIGFEGGDIKIFSFEYKNRAEQNYVVDLYFSQKFASKFLCEPINI
jgi:WD40 repeat protein